jgi:hypothetical protein
MHQQGKQRIATPLIAKWAIGLVAGTLIIALTSPWFVRSYLPDDFCAERKSFVPVSGDYRWRSEGYATTKIGPYGMPGRTELRPKSDDVMRIALWGDSQAEGVCVRDNEKLFAQIQRSANYPVEVLPLARSGQSAVDWLSQMPVVEQELQVDAHLMLIVDLPDLSTVDLASHQPDSVQSNSKIAANLPAFVIQAGRYLLHDSDGYRRHLRFSVGPENAATDSSLSLRESRPLRAGEGRAETSWKSDLHEIRCASELPILIAYAPKSPSISSGIVQWDNPHVEEFHGMRQAAEEAGITVIDTTSALRESARAGHWPHGFHNGQFGTGHLNTIGNEVIAAEIANGLSRLTSATQDERP